MDNDYLSNPHDKFFKESFSRKEVVESFISEYIPETVTKQIDLNTLEILKDSFIDKELTEHFSDLLYKVKIAGKPSFLYLLFEHKSFPDSMTHFQLLRNTVKILELYLKQNKNSRKLPVVISLVIYHGSQKWDIKNSIVPLFEEIEGTVQYIPDFRAEILDISHIPDDMIKGEIFLQVHFLIQKYIHTPQLFDKLPDIFMLVKSLTEDRKKTEYMEMLLRYLAASVEKDKKQDLKEEIKKAIHSGDTLMTTIAEEWVQEGEIKGKIEGKIEGKEEDAFKMAQLGMSNEIIQAVTGLPMDKIIEIRKRAGK